MYPPENFKAVVCVCWLQPRSVEQQSQRVRRLLGREEKKREQLQELGLDYPFPGYQQASLSGASSTTPTHTVFSSSEEQQTASDMESDSE